MLLERGIDIDVKALLRVMLEAIFSLAAIVKEPPFAETLIRIDDARRKYQQEQALESIEIHGGQFRPPEQVSELKKAVAADIAKEPSKKLRNVRAFDIRQIAIKGGLEKFYLHDYTFLCSFSHGNPEGLRDMLHVTDKPFTIKLQFGQEVKDMHANITLAINFIKIAIGNFCDYLKIPISKELLELSTLEEQMADAFAKQTTTHP